MKLLLDTHAVLWWLADAELSETAREAIADPDHLIAVSSASVWEVAIKRALGKLEAPDGLVDVLTDSGFEPLPILQAHAEAVGSLPAHHRDPFDRMLIAQARIEDLTIVSRDATFDRYDVPRLAC